MQSMRPQHGPEVQLQRRWVGAVWTTMISEASTGTGSVLTCSKSVDEGSSCSVIPLCEKRKRLVRQYATEDETYSAKRTLVREISSKGETDNEESCEPLGSSEDHEREDESIERSSEATSDNESMATVTEWETSKPRDFKGAKDSGRHLRAHRFRLHPGLVTLDTVDKEQSCCTIQ